MRQIIITCICLLCSALCLADSWTVDDDGKADFSNIQDAIDFASNGDFIHVQPGVYFEAIDFLGKQLVVEGEDASNTIIDGINNQSSVVTFNSGETGQSVISKFTIRNGVGNFWEDPIFGQQRCGGGIYCEGSSPFIQLCVIEENTAWGGGGIFVTQGNPFIFFSDLLHNTAEGYGGGLYLHGNVNANIDSLQVMYNEASWGGGMTCMANSDGNVLNCVFSNNIAQNVGGGMYVRSSSSPIVIGCSFNYNIQSVNPLGSGGGVCIYGSGNGGGPCYPTFRICYFIGNVVNGDGGGMAAAYDAHPKVIDCYFASNLAGRSGGGLACVADPDHLYPSNAEVTNVKFELNQADEEGGGMHVRNSDPTIEFSEMQFNDATVQGGGINFFESPLAGLNNTLICGNEQDQITGKFTDNGGNTIAESCGPCDGDVNQDGIVNVTDLLFVVADWGSCGFPCPSDVNADGTVNITDILIVVGAWGPC